MDQSIWINMIKKIENSLKLVMNNELVLLNMFCWQIWYPNYHDCFQNQCWDLDWTPWTLTNVKNKITKF